MKQVLDLQLPQGLVEALKGVSGQPGVAVPISRNFVVAVDNALQATINESLADVRERERTASGEALKLRFR